MRALKSKLPLAAGTYWFDVETAGGYRGASAFSVPVAEGAEVVIPIQR